MPRVVYEHPDGSLTILDGEAGQSVMSLAVQNGVDGIIGECGGSCACATSHVYVGDTFLRTLQSMGELEDDMLSGTASERTPNSRLSCQIVLTEDKDGIVVALPVTQL
jgi:ferredoxin, 2Fe-2S